jgi:hypothetical protein
MRVQPEETTDVTLRFFSIAIGVAIVHFSSGVVILINAKAFHATCLCWLMFYRKGHGLFRLCSWRLPF